MLDLYSMKTNLIAGNVQIEVVVSFAKKGTVVSWLGFGRNITVCRTNYLFISIGLVSSRMFLMFKCLQCWRGELRSCFVMIYNILGRNVELRALVPLSSFTKDSGALFHKVRQVSSVVSVILWSYLAVSQHQDFLELGITSSINLWMWS